MKRFKLFIILIIFWLCFIINFSVSRYFFTEKYPNLTQTNLRHNFIKITIWDHANPNK